MLEERSPRPTSQGHSATFTKCLSSGYLISPPSQVHHFCRGGVGLQDLGHVGRKVTTTYFSRSVLLLQNACLQDISQPSIMSPFLSGRCRTTRSRSCWKKGHHDLLLKVTVLLLQNACLQDISLALHHRFTIFVGEVQDYKIQVMLEERSPRPTSQGHSATFTKCLSSGYLISPPSQVHHFCRGGVGLQDLGHVGRKVITTYFSRSQCYFYKMLVFRISHQPSIIGSPFLQGRCRTTRSRSCWKKGHHDLLLKVTVLLLQNACLQDISLALHHRFTIFVGEVQDYKIQVMLEERSGHDLLLKVTVLLLPNACLQDISLALHHRFTIFVGEVQDYKIQVMLEERSPRPTSQGHSATFTKCLSSGYLISPPSQVHHFCRGGEGLQDLGHVGRKVTTTYFSRSQCYFYKMLVFRISHQPSIIGSPFLQGRCRTTRSRSCWKKGHHDLLLKVTVLLLPNACLQDISLALHHRFTIFVREVKDYKIQVMLEERSSRPTSQGHSATFTKCLSSGYLISPPSQVHHFCRGRCRTTRSRSCWKKGHHDLLLKVTVLLLQNACLQDISLALHHRFTIFVGEVQDYKIQVMLEERSSRPTSQGHSATFTKCLSSGYLISPPSQVHHFCRGGVGLQDLGHVGRKVITTYFSRSQCYFYKMLVFRISHQPSIIGSPFLQGRCRTTRSRSCWKKGHHDLLLKVTVLLLPNACLQDISLALHHRFTIFVGEVQDYKIQVMLEERSPRPTLKVTGHKMLVFRISHQPSIIGSPFLQVYKIQVMLEERLTYFSRSQCYFYKMLVFRISHQPSIIGSPFLSGEVQDYKIQVMLEERSPRPTSQGHSATFTKCLSSGYLISPPSQVHHFCREVQDYKIQVMLEERSSRPTSQGHSATFTKCLSSGYLISPPSQVHHFCRGGEGLQDLGHVGRKVITTYFSRSQCYFYKMLVFRISHQPSIIGSPFLQGRCRTTRSRSCWKKGHHDLLLKVTVLLLQNACLQDISLALHHRFTIFVGEVQDYKIQVMLEERSSRPTSQGHSATFTKCLSSGYLISPPSGHRFTIFVGEVKDYKIQVMLEERSSRPTSQGHSATFTKCLSSGYLISPPSQVHHFCRGGVGLQDLGHVGRFL